LSQFFWLSISYHHHQQQQHRYGKKMQLFTFMEENGNICLDSGNVTMMLTYCDSKTKSEHFSGEVQRV